MNLPIPGQERTVSDAVVEDEGQGFMAMMQMHQSNVGGSR